jgi:RNA polymerase sigma-70 factor (ECF subfamily)
VAGQTSNDGFEAVVLPHLDAAYNLARWLVRNPTDAEDIVQEAALRAYRFYGSYRGGNSPGGGSAKAWLLAIVRNICFTWMRAQGQRKLVASAEELGIDRPLEPFAAVPWERPTDDPESLLQRAEDRSALDRLIAALPPEYREALILRELEDLSYKEIAEIAGVPIGTVMSRLARARRQAQDGWRRLEQADKAERRGTAGGAGGVSTEGRDGLRG